jgi:hypothetical protein
MKLNVCSVLTFIWSIRICRYASASTSFLSNSWTVGGGLLGSHRIWKCNMKHLLHKTIFYCTYTFQPKIQCWKWYGLCSESTCMSISYNSKKKKIKHPVKFHYISRYVLLKILSLCNIERCAKWHIILWNLGYQVDPQRFSGHLLTVVLKLFKTWGHNRLINLWAIGL